MRSSPRGATTASSRSRGRTSCTAPKCILYYTFVKSSKPHLGKYNVMQKATYMFFVPLLITQAFTGFSLVVTPFIFGYSPRDLLAGLVAWSVPGLDRPRRMVRAHPALRDHWLFIILTTMHAYLSFTEDFPAIRDFFGVFRFPRGERCPWPESQGGPSHAQEPATAVSAVTQIRPPQPETAGEVSSPGALRSGQAGRPAPGDIE